MQADTIDFGGFLVGVDLDRWPAKILRALLRRHYERNERHLLLRLLRQSDTVLELGSAIGVVALACARTVAPGRIFCIDANPAMIEQARANFALNRVAIPLDNRVLVSGADAPSETTFYATPYFLSSSLARHRDDMEPVTVPCADLDRTIAKRGATALVVDIEGGEFGLLPGARLDGIERLSVELHLEHGGIDGCLSLIRGLAGRGLTLDSATTSENVFVFTREPATDTPDAFAAAYLSALDAQRHGDTAGAATHMDEAARLSPANASAHVQRAAVHARLGDLDAALAASTAALEADPAHPDALEQRGELSAASGNDEAAASAFEAASAMDPCRPLFSAGLATVYLREGREKDALAALERAASLVPPRARAFKTLAALAARQDKFDADAPGAQPSVGGRAERHAALERLSKRISGRFKLAQAGRALATALALAPDDEALQVAIAHLTATPKDLREAL